MNGSLFVRVTNPVCGRGTRRRVKVAFGIGRRAREWRAERRASGGKREERRGWNATHDENSADGGHVSRKEMGSSRVCGARR